MSDFDFMEDFKGLEIGVKAAEGFIHLKQKLKGQVLSDYRKSVSLILQCNIFLILVHEYAS